MKKIIAMLLAVCMTFCACALAEEDAVDLSLIDVKERGMLRVGMDKDYAPFCLIDETNEYTGFDVDFAYAICDALDVALEIVPLEWRDSRAALEEGRVDMLMGGLAQTDDDYLRYSYPYIETKTVIAVKGDSGLETMDALKGKTIGLREGACEKEVLEENPDFYQTLSAAYSFPTAYELLNTVENGKVDAALVDALVAQVRIDEGANLKTIEGPEAVWQLTAAFPAGSAALCGAVNEAMVTLAFNGVLSDMAADWFGSDITILARYLVEAEESGEE